MALDFFPETAAELVDAYMTFAEPGDYAGAAYFLKFFVYLVEIVVLGYFDLYTAFEVAGLFERNLYKMKRFYVVVKY